MIKQIAVFCLALAAVSPGSAQEETDLSPTITASEWQAYRDAYVTEQGRVVDTANGNISHSEGQGYGLLLAVLADDRASFERIWSFTRTDLMVRDDGLAAWHWDPEATPNITDANNASDGDLLIAYALARAGDFWDDAQKLQQAGAIARTLAERVLVEHDGKTIILPGVDGFSAQNRPDGPIVNPSYWVFEAFPVLDALVPEAGWAAASDDGLALLEELAEEGALPGDWMSLAGETPVPADGFPAEFGYNNIRIPLYLLRAGLIEGPLASYAAIFGAADAPARIEIETGERLEEMTERGYRLVGAATECVLDGGAVSPELIAFEPSTYYSATLQLLALDYLRREQPQCLASGANTEGVPS